MRWDGAKRYIARIFLWLVLKCMHLKLSLDDQLAPIIEKLHSMHKIGNCSEHPGIRCFRWVANDWHFNIDSTRTKVWANAIVSRFSLLMYMLLTSSASFVR